MPLWLAVGPVLASPIQDDAGFAVWLEGVRQEALARGIRDETLARVLPGIVPLPRVLELDQRQPEFIEPFLDYLERRLTPTRIEEGRKRLRELAPLLEEIRNRYGVPPHILIALWGLETNYGTHLGEFPVPAALATLAYDSRRSRFFRGQFLDALAILDAGHVTPEAMRGSWAGAMGQMQFMPSTFVTYAVDADGDGRKDLWHSLPDAFASAAHYLQRLGWREDERWGREVRLPADFDWELARPWVSKPLSAWAALGVRQADGQPLPSSGQMGAIVLPQGHQGPAFLVYANFERLMSWNRSLNYALAVGLLADRLRGGPQLQGGGSARHERIGRREITQMQRQLNALGFDAGEADGVVGARTRAALRAFQRRAGMPADGYPSPEVLARIQAAAGSLEVAAAPAMPPADLPGPQQMP